MTLKANKKNQFDFTNSCLQTPKKFFYEEIKPTPVKNPKLIKLNNKLCDFLNLDKQFLMKSE